MRFMFEMRFAEYYFNNDAARDVGFFAWLRQGFFGLVKDTPVQPNWEKTEERGKLRDTVSKVLDIFYLHKRIAFLERALTILLDKHQLKGLHLAHNLTKEESDEKFKSYRLRERVVTFLSKYSRTSTFGILGRGGSSKDSDQELNLINENRISTIKFK